ncbi:uncharacterized protein B0T23DRAFT_165923 [Neurospora hispaniola]|uniref:Uncharacterized protein n=1 Tax=Neurospora hispaniola TaxID=588809 RepID=A0AAJ0I5V0_9PEZI|nr:hypothetical protein B0T23DRAFT_165923 [Neurospora hispaniola]
MGGYHPSKFMFGGDRCWTREAEIVKNEMSVELWQTQMTNGTMARWVGAVRPRLEWSVSRRVPACLFFLSDFGQIMSSTRPPLSSVPVENRHDGSCLEVSTHSASRHRCCHAKGMFPANDRGATACDTAAAFPCLAVRHADDPSVSSEGRPSRAGAWLASWWGD